MLGRRSYTRVTIAQGAEGVLCLSRDVAVTERTEGEWVATSREAGRLGETVLVSMLDEGVTLQAQVVDSKPIVTDGVVRHRLWLRAVAVDLPVANIIHRER